EDESRDRLEIWQPVRELVAVLIAVVVDDRIDPIPDDVHAPVVMTGPLAHVDDDPVLVVEAAEVVVLDYHRRAPAAAAVLRDIDRNSAAKSLVRVPVEDQRVRVDEVVRAERNDGVARSLHQPALAGKRGQTRQLAV